MGAGELMAVGVRIRNRNTGVVTLGPTDRISRIIGTIGPVSSAGSINVPAFNTARNTPWVIVLQRNLTSNLQVYRTVVATISGTTLSWSLTGTDGWAVQPATIIYGLQ